jgi:hypothetical protein
MGCSDPLVLQRLLDNELDEAQAELVTHHLESCASCRAQIRLAAEARSFVQDQLGVEDEGEEDATTAALAAISRHLPAQTARPQASSSWKRRTWLTAAAGILALFLPLLVVSNVSAWPARILEEAAMRERMWMYQRNKVLHWEVDTVSQGVKNVADGRWRTLFWRKNGASTFLEVSRQINPAGRTEYAYWQKPDGSTIHYRSKKGVIEIGPSTAVARQTLPTLSGELRTALDSYLSNRAQTRNLDFHSRRDADRLHGRSIWVSGGKATFRRGLLDLWGEVHHITVVKERSESNPMVVRAVHEYDVESSTYRLLRLKSTVSYADGTVGVHDSRWVVFQEVAAAEFDAQTPRDFLESGTPVVRLTPLDVATRRVQEINEAGK